MAARHVRGSSRFTEKNDVLVPARFAVTDSEPGTNAYGPDPKAGHLAAVGRRRLDRFVRDGRQPYRERASAIDACALCFDRSAVQSHQAADQRPRVRHFAPKISDFLTLSEG
ncbi:MAG: hypothetical protein AMXMBFR52_26440 [Burkholderiales bacterium]|jgi:hypothetical protein